MPERKQTWLAGSSWLGVLACDIKSESKDGEGRDDAFAVRRSGRKSAPEEGCFRYCWRYDCANASVSSVRRLLEPAFTSQRLDESL